MEIEYNDFMKNYPHLQELDPSSFPTGLNVSTMTITCKLPVTFNASLIAKHIEISPNFIMKIKFGNNSEIFRQCVSNEKEKKRKNKRVNKKNFFNQVSLLINMGNLNKNRRKKKKDIINVKFFNNGSIQLTGCKSISTVVFVINKLFTMMKNPIITETETNTEIKTDINTENDTKYYAEPIIFVDILDLYDIKICMINSDFSIGFNIDRYKLFEVINLNPNELYDCVYDSSRHASVMIHYHHGEIDKKKKKEIITTILVFAKGTVIITGSRNYMKLMECYKFINIFLLEHYAEIVA